MTETNQNTLYQAALTAFKRGDLDRAQSLATDLLARQPDCVETHQLLARIYLAQDELENARGVFERRDELPRDQRYAGWGRVAEELDQPDQALAIYTDHLSRFPHDGEAHYRLGLLFLDRNDTARAETHLLGCLKVTPDFPPALQELAHLYEEQGLLGLAGTLYERILALHPDNTEIQTTYTLLQTRLAELNSLPEVELEPVVEAAQTLADLFQGREGVYARQWLDNGGRIGYSPVHEPLTPQVLENHLRGTYTVGVYPLRSDQQITFAALDVDLNKRVLSQAHSDPGLQQKLQAQTRDDARRLVGLMTVLGLPVYMEWSGYKGYHLWLFLAEPLPAVEVRAFLQALIKQAGPPATEIHREIFPKQDRVEEGQLGNLIKLPLGLHKKTGQRALFVDGEGKAYADQVAYLKDIRRISKADFEQSVARLLGVRSRESVPTQGESGPPPEGTSLALDETALAEQFPDLAPIWTNCKIIGALIRKAQATHHLTYEERHVLRCVFAHFGERGRAFLHAVIRLCLDYRFETTEYHIKQTRPNPISCPRIRHYLPDIAATVSCACVFDLPQRGYPSPVLYADSQFTKGLSKFKTDQADQAVNRYIELRNQLRGLRRELQEAEQRLLDQLQAAGTDLLITEHWLVRREEKTNTIHIELKGE